MKAVFLRGLLSLCIVGPAIVLAQSREEYDALMKIQNEPSVETRIQLGEEFFQKFPNSVYGPHVHLQLVYAYNQQKKVDQVIQHGEGAKSLKEPRMLTILASAYDERKTSDKTLETTRAAIELLSGAEPPAGLSADAKNELLSFNHYLEGVAYYRQAKEKKGDDKNALLSKAKESFEAALKSKPKNDLAYYQLGLTLAEMSQGTAAVEALAKAVVLEGPAKPYAQQDLEKIYMHYNNKSKKGLDKVLVKAKADIK